MGTRYTSQATSGYNASPPPDDGTQVASNLITWAGVKTKLADVLKTFGEAINTALVAALDLSARAISSNDTAIASDHWKTLQVTGTTTISLSSAASMGSGYEVGVLNIGSGVVTVTPAGSDTINGLSASITVPIKSTVVFRTNVALTGYNVVAQSNRMDAGNIDGAVIGATTPAAGTFTTLSASSGLTPNFTSSETAITAAGATATVAHGLGAVPRSISVVVRNKTTELGYSVGDEVQCPGGTTLGFYIYADATNVGLMLGATAGIAVPNRSSGNAITAITAGNWKYVVRAWK